MQMWEMRNAGLNFTTFENLSIMSVETITIPGPLYYTALAVRLMQ